MGAIAIVGVLIQITASVHGYRYWQLVAGKLINSISMGIACNVVPTYQSELAPAKWRGAIINLYQAVQIIGVVIATAVVYSLSTKDSTMAWQIPVGLQFVAPFILLVGVTWMPESPRWLVWQGRTEEARDVLHRLHGEDPNYSATAEVEALVAAFDEEKAIRAPSLLDVFKGTDLRRTMISVGVQCLQQAQGSSYMTNYIVLFLISLGMTNVFQVVMILYCLYLAAILFSFILPDYFGRRPMLIWGAAVCAACLTIVSALNVGISPATDSSQKAGLAMIFIWYFVFGLVWSPLTWITSTEVCSARVREPTLTLATFSGFGVGLIITFVSPYIQDAQYGNLGGSIGFIWAAFTWISIPFVYFLIPEFKGLSLERIDYLFEHKVATRQFQSYQGGMDEENVPTVSHSGSFDKADADK
ncbi:general substrate transporter [Leucosporidium creatinivorum]|uniref:General substrate transporter n=1 Tax=Leucosporidium creatinivorum TaxID=106004 RepID=A0A1Y2FG74_9BASI|nr:general substrate transporter [Leucosporidium creatinivorum]